MEEIFIKNQKNKIFFTYLIIIFFFSNFASASILDFKQYNCIADDNFSKTQINIEKKYNDEFILQSEDFGFAKMYTFAKVKNDTLVSYNFDFNYNVIHVSTLGFVQKSNTKEFRDYKTFTYRLNQTELKKLQNANSKIITSDGSGKNLDLNDNELIKEIELYKKIDGILKSALEQVGDPIKYRCNIGKENISKNINSKPPLEYIEVLKNGCKQNNNSDPQIIKFCNCYGNWFYNNLNEDEFRNFLYLSSDEKRKFVQKNRIVEFCKLKRK